MHGARRGTWPWSTVLFVKLLGVVDCGVWVGGAGRGTRPWSTDTAVMIQCRGCMVEASEPFVCTRCFLSNHCAVCRWESLQSWSIHFMVVYTGFWERLGASAMRQSHILPWGASRLCGSCLPASCVLCDMLVCFLMAAAAAITGHSLQRFLQRTYALKAAAECGACTRCCSIVAGSHCREAAIHVHHAALFPLHARACLTVACIVAETPHVVLSAVLCLRGHCQRLCYVRRPLALECYAVSA